MFLTQLVRADSHFVLIALTNFVRERDKLYWFRNFVSEHFTKKTVSWLASQPRKLVECSVDFAVGPFRWSNRRTHISRYSHIEIRIHFVSQFAEYFYIV